MSEEKREPRYVYTISRDEIASTVHIGKSDLTLLKAYKNIMRMPITAVLHAMIGRSVKCWEEKHDDFIIDLQKKNRTLARIVIVYLEKYGPITKKDLRKTEKETKVDEKSQSVEKDAISEH